MDLVKRLPRKMKKQLKKRGIDPKQFLEEVRLFQYRDKHLAEIFTRDYENAHRIVQKEIMGV